MREATPTITLTTDFGTADHYVAAIKGVILWINPAVNIVDITHDIPPHDIFEAAFIIKNAYQYFPPDSIHITVVDPGVGSNRRPLLICTDHHHFLAPDNGVLTFILEHEHIVEAYELTAKHYWRGIASDTFHGRDIFAPVAGWLSKGTRPRNFGEPTNAPVKIKVPTPQNLDEKRILGTIIHIDRFGNAVLNVDMDHMISLNRDILKNSLKLKSGNVTITDFKKTYAEGEQGKPFFLFNSSNHLEIAMNQSSAASTLNLKRGSEVLIEIE
jgi:S-adenosylmethionine hydrolase